MKKPNAIARESKRLEILRSAASAFRRHGYHGTNLIQIASIVNMTKGNLYNYFKSKEEILFFCHDYGMKRLLKLLGSIQKSPYPADVKLRRMILGFVHMMVDELDGEILSLEVKELSGTRLRQILAKRDQLDRGLRRIIQDGVKDGIFRPVDVKLLGFTIWGSMNWIPRWFHPQGSAGSVEISEVMIDCYLNGIVNENGQRPKRRKNKTRAK
jgi:AcrR family transcriptional regulator